MSDVGASRAFDPHQTDEKLMQSWDVGSWAHDHCTIAVVDRSSPNQMARVSRGKFSLKTDVFSSFTQLLIES